MRYTTKDGLVLEGRDRRDIVRSLRRASFDKASSIQKFMEDTAVRAYAQTGREVRTDSEANFLSDLCVLGLMEEERDR
jgi:hypothetical protein